jgi:hypothetical protein
MIAIQYLHPAGHRTDHGPRVSCSSFCKGSKLFKLRYSQIELEKDVAGSLKRILLSEPSGMTSVLVHSCRSPCCHGSDIVANEQQTVPGTRIPIPHLEQPVTSSSSHISRVSFLEEQTVQTASTLFQAQPHYTFHTWEGTSRLHCIPAHCRRISDRHILL